MYKPIAIPLDLPEPTAEITVLPEIPPDVGLSLRPLAGRPFRVAVHDGEEVEMGAILAESDEAYLHAPISGKVALHAEIIVIHRRTHGSWNPHDAAACSRVPGTDLARFMILVGAVGMGGSQFPSGLKLRAAQSIHTLVINGTECEPGISIDQSLLLSDIELIRLGAETVAKAAGAQKIILAVKRNKRMNTALLSRYAYPLTLLPKDYPAGAEKLIVSKLAGRRLPAGAYPFHLGYLVHNVATLRGIGRAIRDGIPFIERPLSVLDLVNAAHRNLIVPVGTSFKELIRQTGLVFDLEKHRLVAGGVMMGRHVTPADRIEKGTAALLLVPASWVAPPARSCIHCGACYDACPLGLHPFEMVRRIDERRPLTLSTRAHIDECFLCGACASVCPSHIPLVRYLREAKHA